jgi:hypothetical protein
MAEYMVQKMSSGIKKATTYYRKQKQSHVSHEVSSKFTFDAKADYAKKMKVALTTVEEGHYQSGMGVPTGGDVELI